MPRPPGYDINWLVRTLGAKRAMPLILADLRFRRLQRLNSNHRHRP